jgi:hypothetical protein
LVRERSLHGLALERTEKLGDRRYGPSADVEIKKGFDYCC